MKEANAAARRQPDKASGKGSRQAAPQAEGGPAMPAAMGPVSLLRLQATAGNAAVARLLNPVQRKGDAGSCPPSPPTPAPADPHADPKFAKVEKDVKGKAKDLKKHPPAAEEAKKAQDAAQPPGDDRASQAKAAQADTMAAAKPKGFDKAAFVAAVKQAIAAAAPKNLDEADKFANSSKPGEIKAAVASKVTKGKDDSGKEVAEKTKQAPDPSVAKVKPVVPLKEEPPPSPAAVDGAKAMPDKAPKDQTDLRAGPCEVDAKMKDAEVTEEHLAKSNEAPMQEAAKAKKEAEVHAAEAPADIRQKEAAAQQTAQSGAGAGAKTALSAMVGTKGKLGGNVAAKKAAAKAQEEADRARISREINAIFDRTKTETEAKLTGLDTKVASEFDAGEAKAKAAFTAKHKADMDKYKDERYSGPTGWAQWTADLFTGLPPEANQIFDRAKAQYESEMTGVISRIADMIGKELEDAKARIEKGRQEIKAYVDSQPKELQKLAGETAKGVGDQFNQLESDVDAKQESLVNDLAQKYVEARGKVDEEIKAEQDKNKGLVDKAKEAVGGAIDAILKLKDLFMGLLAKAASAFTKILNDPLGFIGNFMNAIKTGFMNFANNILDHLKKGLMGWLLGALANAGIEIPDSFDLKGILKLVASILGLTWTNIKARIVKIAPWIGKAIDVIESKVEVFVILATKGVAGVWEWIKDKVGDLKEMVLGPIKDFVVEKIVKAGISWVLGMLNPAGALIKIVQALIGVVQWIMERGAALGEFISTVIDAVSSIAHGGAGGVPAKIESALAKAVPLVISFLANLLGLGGISEKIKSVLETVQKPVGKAIDGIVKAGLRAAKPLIAGMAKLGQKAKAKLLGGDDSPEGKKKRVGLAVKAGLGLANRFAGKTVGERMLKPLLGAVRMRYGLTSLEPVKQGTVWAIRGRINPEEQGTSQAKVEEGIRKLGDELHMIIRDVAERVILDPNVIQQIEKIMADREAKLGTTKNAPRPSQSAAAEAGAIIMSPRPAQSQEFIGIGGRTVREKQTESSGAGHIKTLGMGHGRYDPHISAKLTQLKASLSGELTKLGVTSPDAKVAETLRTISQGGLPPAPFNRAKPASLLAAISRLIFHVEPGRSPSALVTSWMSVESAAQGSQTITEAVTVGPMTPTGAGGQARGAGAQMGYPVPSEAKSVASRPAIQAFLQREKRVAIEYVFSLVKAKDPMFKDDQQWQRFIERELLDFLYEQTRQRMTATAAQP